MPAPSEVIALVERFSQNLDLYRRSGYKETPLRVEFIDPFFEALGWDVRNVKGYSEQYKDVVHEETISVGGDLRTPDYCFRIGGTRKFFLEAKKPSIDLRIDIAPAYQLRRYAWSAKLPVSILTDFEEFAVYDCRLRPKPSDKSSVARIMYYKYEDYVDCFDEISHVFAKESVLEGSFDQYIRDAGLKKGTSEVDIEFLDEIENWREHLAKNIALRNPDLTIHELNFSVQRTIDRIIFLRMAEDRGIEEYGRLRNIGKTEDVYKSLVRYYHQGDDKYNAGLFNFNDDQLTPNILLDNKTLAPILLNLYYPESPYQFSVLPPDVLGQVYEQFLGKVIRLTPKHRAVVEEKPEVKRAGGVFYTPTYIVDYIVAETVGKLIKDRTPSQISKIRILDPACGSGTFLLAAYQRLLDAHLEYYKNNDPEKHSKRKRPTIYKDTRASWSLTTSEKKRILLNNIFGVDIDRQAVEVTKLSLLLKVLEGETDESLGQQMKLWRERALPDLGNNIRCGNSLIGTDYFQAGEDYSEDIFRSINPFDWESEFKEIIEDGGFHALIGNPPYIRMEGFKGIKSYLKQKFISHEERSDIYVYFVEMGISLLRRGGYFGMILSNKFLRTKYGAKLRQFLTSSVRIECITDFAGLPVFPKATVRTVVFLSTKYKSPHDEFVYTPPLPTEDFRLVRSGSQSVENAITTLGFPVSQSDLTEESWSLIRSDEVNLLNRLTEDNVRLEEYCENKIFMGIKSGLTKAFVLNEKLRERILTKNPEAINIIKPFLNGRDIRQFQITPPGLFLIYTYHGVAIDRYPAIEEHLLQFKESLKRRATKQAWYELQQPQHNYAKYLDKSKLVFPDMATSPRFALDKDGHYISNTVYFIPGNDLYLLGLLNSFVAQFYFSSICAALEGPGESYLRFFGQYLKGFPVRVIEPEDKNGMEYKRNLIAIVKQVADLKSKQSQLELATDIDLIQRQIDAFHSQLDQVVQKIYGVSDKDFQIAARYKL